MKITQDLVQGGLFLAVGLVALVLALQYPLGTPGRMGPGFFPVAVSGLLALTGAAILLRARLGGSEMVQVTRWTPLVIVPVAVVGFGILLDKLGLPLAVLLLTVAAATASLRFRLGWKPLAGAVVFAIACGILFNRLLGLPIPLAGTWLQAVGIA